MAATFDPGTQLGPRLRQVREDRGLSVRELARRIDCSPSLISQIERGLSAPSVGILYALATELRTSMDFLFGAGPPGDVLASTVHGRGRVLPTHTERGQGNAVPERVRDEAEARDVAPAPTGGHGIVQRVNSRRTIDLASGVRWERLTPGPDDRVDFLEVVYQPSGRSTDTGRLLRHDGQEYGLVIDGTLQASVGFETVELSPGDSIAFDSSIPHQYWNPTSHDVHAVWVVVHGAPGRA